MGGQKVLQGRDVRGEKLRQPEGKLRRKFVGGTKEKGAKGEGNLERWGELGPRGKKSKPRHTIMNSKGSRR